VTGDRSHKKSVPGITSDGAPHTLAFPVKKGLLTDGCRAQLNIRWAERHCEIPDGPRVGQPFRRFDFQREIIRGIYADSAYWSAVGSVLKKKGRAA
jgi:hypothetical protein